MKSAILSVGTEILFGQITNTNTVYLSQKLNMLGIDVMYHHSVGDNSKRLADMIKQAFLDCDLIITTGGLGPTQDDLTKEIACEVLNDQLIPHEPSMKWLEDHFQRMGRKMTENNWKQGYLPSRATVFENEVGTAPGFALEDHGNTIICMPGPPREMKHMFETHVIPYLENQTEEKIFYRNIRLFGIGESQVETDLITLINDQTDPTIATYAKEVECSVRVASKRGNLKDATSAVDGMTDKISKILGDYIYSIDDEELHQVVGKKLIERNITVASAESCTGGLFAQTITEIPGISAVFDRGFVTYSNQSKISELGVNPQTLDQFGAVSKETAIEMAQGLQKKTGCRLCISVTGIAGPGGATPDKPIGLVYVCVIFDGETICRQTNIRNINRTWNRNFAKLYMLDMVNKIIEGKTEM